LYTVQVKNVTATEARKSWFRLLDEAAEGEVVVIEREGVRLLLHRDEGESRTKAEAPSYEGLIRVDDADTADEWSWEWQGPDDGLALRTGGRGR
jgi:antitoxin (DNA-binding transcriptional repressor) of toxin-antitoxin stability system